MADPGTDVTHFLSGMLEPAAFSHREHVRMAFEMLRRHSFVHTALRFSEVLQSMARRSGKPEAFHQTITIAFLALVAERLEAATYTDFESFVATNPDLLDKSALTRWYRPDQLAQRAARRTFILPGPAR